ncbi:hypothetical protein H7K20_12600 [Priestia aryabhattai]|uniref:hypothetical protein n=1 Tax=Priestia aryabhattai TaxID=412384 RepID=UPI001C8E97CC|nr:hypothetical protein [Priestia aryabhattai]MBY0027941.1 hypothetical protein [Priestia aryabhattai]
MARGHISTVDNLSRKISKDEKNARKMAENEIKAVGIGTPEPIMPLNDTEQSLFDKYVELNDSFNAADSTALTLLVNSMYMYTELILAAKELPVYDDNRANLERRALAFDKAAQQHAASLSISLTSRLRMANDMAKVMIEEKKLANMEAQPVQEVNPLLAILEGAKNVK